MRCQVTAVPPSLISITRNPSHRRLLLLPLSLSIFLKLIALTVVVFFFFWTYCDRLFMIFKYAFSFK